MSKEAGKLECRISVTGSGYHLATWINQGVTLNEALSLSVFTGRGERPFSELRAELTPPVLFYEFSVHRFELTDVLQALSSYGGIVLSFLAVDVARGELLHGSWADRIGSLHAVPFLRSELNSMRSLVTRIDTAGFDPRVFIAAARRFAYVEGEKAASAPGFWRQ